MVDEGLEKELFEGLESEGEEDSDGSSSEKSSLYQHCELAEKNIKV